MPALPPGYSIQQIPSADRPRERLSRYGADALSSAELIAIVLGSGMRGRSVLQLAQEVIAHFGSLEKLSQASKAELCEIKGLGEAKALQLLATFSLGNRTAQLPPNLSNRIEMPRQIFDMLREEIELEKREVFVVVLLDIKRSVICREIIAVGTLSNILVHPREVFYPAVRNKAHSVILVHNHPSGDPTPSPQDRVVTAQLIESGRMIGIPIDDHVILGHQTFHSMREGGYPFDK